MKIVNDTLPTEGVVINGIHFLPGKVTSVDDELGKALIARKGFKRAAEPTTKEEG